jgi:hypothetical protein
MRRTAFLFAAVLLACAPSVRAQSTADRAAGAAAADSLALRDLAVRLTADVHGDSARAAALYEWVAGNVRYDVASYRRGSDGHATAEAVYRHREAVCAGYVALYARLAVEAGLEAVPIRGYAKGFDYVYGQSTRRPNHAWLAVRIAGAWRLVDPTWGAGVVEHGRFVPRFTWDWFMVAPERLLLSHLPEDAGWQLAERPLRRADFERTPPVPVSLVTAGFTPAAIRTSALGARAADFPLVGAGAAGARVISAPLTGTLRRQSSVSLDLQWPDAADVAVVTGGAWTALQRTGDRFHGDAVAADSHLYVVGRASAAEPYRTLLLYRVE